MTCETCKHWNIEVLALGYDWGKCQKIGPTCKPDEKPTAYTKTEKLSTRQDFGCNQYEPKERA